MKPTVHELETAEEYIQTYLDLTEGGKSVIRNPEPPYFLGFLCEDTQERWVIEIRKFKETGDLALQTKLFKAIEKAKKAKKKAEKAKAKAAAKAQEVTVEEVPPVVPAGNEETDPS